MTGPGVGGAASPMSARQVQEGSRVTQRVSREVTQATKQVEAVAKLQRPQDPKAAATFDKNLKQAAKLARDVNVKSTQIGKQTAANVKGLPAADQKLVTKDIGKHVQDMDKGGTSLDKAVANLQKSAAAPAKGKAKAGAADDKKAVAASADLLKMLQSLAAEMDAVDKNVVKALGKGK